MKRKKRWYVFGIISLIGLPVLFFIWPVEDRPNYTSLMLFLIKDDIDTSKNLRYPKYDVYETLKNKKIETVFLWDVPDLRNYDYRTAKDIQFDLYAVKCCVCNCCMIQTPY